MNPDEQPDMIAQRLLPEPERARAAAEAGYARPITLMLPKRIKPALPWVGHIPFAFWIVDVLRPCRFVELGTHSGNSFCAFLQAAELTAPGDYIAVDHWRGDEYAGHYGDEVFYDLKHYVETNHGPSASLLRMTFDEALAHIEDASIDLLHIDGRHGYEDVHRDFEAWLPKMTERGFVLLHDTALQQREMGVHTLFAELAERYPTFDFVHSYGLGVVQVGRATPPDPLARLLRGEVDLQGVDPRAYFERLGSALVDRYYLKQLSEQVDHRERLASMNTDESRTPERDRAAAASLRATLASYKDQTAVTRSGELQAHPTAVLLASPFFDPVTYRESAGLPEMDDHALARHYLELGEAAGLPPSQHFDPIFYRAQNPDVAAQGMNLLLHYIGFGRWEGRLPRAPEAARDE